MLKFFKKNFDEIAILAVFAKIKFSENPVLIGDENSIVFALTRYTNKLSDDASVDDIREYLDSYTPEQLQGIANGVKGILHELEFVQFENMDNDGVYATMFDDTNHEGYDIQFFDDNDGLLGEAQLKATDNVNYVEDWIEKNDGEIIVTSELAEKMGLESSGISNEDLTVRTEEFIDKMTDEGFDESMFDYFPSLSVLSISLIIYELWKRYEAGDISYKSFKVMSMYVSGYKISKIAVISILLSIPGINIVTSVVLLSRLLLSLYDQTNMTRENIGPIDVFKQIGNARRA